MGSSDQGGCRQGGTLYGAGGWRSSRARPLRIALAVGGGGVILGALLATGALPGGGGPTGRWVGPTGIDPAGPGGTAAGAGHPPRTGPSGDGGPAPADPQGTPEVPPPALSPLPWSTAASGGVRWFRSVASSLCLAAPVGGAADPHQAGCAAAPGPRWLPAPVQPGVVALVSVATGHCLAVDVPDGGDGAPVRQRPCLGGEHQRWRLLPAVGPAPVAWIPDPVAAVALVNVYSGRCLTLPTPPPSATPSSTPIGTPSDTALRQVVCRGTPDQHWIEESPG